MLTKPNHELPEHWLIDTPQLDFAAGEFMECVDRRVEQRFVFRPLRLGSQQGPKRNTVVSQEPTVGPTAIEPIATDSGDRRRLDLAVEVVLDAQHEAPPSSRDDRGVLNSRSSSRISC